MIVYEVTHKYKLQKHTEKKHIGIYSSYELAEKSIKQLKEKQGFCETQNGFQIKRSFKLLKPKLIDKTFWVDGFITSTH